MSPPTHTTPRAEPNLAKENVEQMFKENQGFLGSCNKKRQQLPLGSVAGWNLVMYRKGLEGNAVQITDGTQEQALGISSILPTSSRSATARPWLR